MENYRRGELPDSEDAVLGYARNMAYKGKHPRAHRVTRQYAKGGESNEAERKILEGSLERESGLEEWATEIPAPAPAIPWRCLSLYSLRSVVFSVPLWLVLLRASGSSTSLGPTIWGRPRSG